MSAFVYILTTRTCTVDKLLNYFLSNRNSRNVVWLTQWKYVRSVGNLTDRVVALNAFLSSLRVKELRRLGTSAWRQPKLSRLNVVWGGRDDYLQLLSNYSNVKTVFMPWSSNVSSAIARSSLADTSQLGDSDVLPVDSGRQSVFVH